MKEEEKIISFLDSHEKEIVSFTQQLVRIRSENSNETAVAKAIQKKLRKYRVKSKLVGEEKERMSLVGANAHSENEYAKVSSISKAAKAIALSALEFLEKQK